MQTLNAQKGFVTERRMSALGCHVGASPLYKIPAKMITQTTSLRKGEKGKLKLCKVVFSCLNFSNRNRAYAAYLCIGISREGKAFPCITSVTTTAPHQVSLCMG